MSLSSVSFEEEVHPLWWSLVSSHVMPGSSLFHGCDWGWTGIHMDVSQRRKKIGVFEQGKLLARAA
eukprot:208053-Pelagomonas_calceolata.AAC.3